MTAHDTLHDAAQRYEWHCRHVLDELWFTRPFGRCVDRVIVRFEKDGEPILAEVYSTHYVHRETVPRGEVVERVLELLAGPVIGPMKEYRYGELGPMPDAGCSCN
jgi:hypothetical protein